MEGDEVDLQKLTALTEASGVPGYEDRIRERVIETLEGRVDSVRTDAMGNVVGTVEGESDHAVAVAAHMDEIGFMVSHVRGDDDGFGFLELDALGGWDPRVLKAQRVKIHTENDDLPGVIGSPPPHTQSEDEREATPEIDDLYVDPGLPKPELEERVSVGDLVTMDRRTRGVGDLVTGKSLDDRVCLYGLLEAADRIENPDATIHFCATVQEEVGLRGARALGVDLDPDLAIALDVTVANDVPGFEQGEYVTELGDGVAIKLKDSSVITSPKVHRRLRRVADDLDIEYQHEILPAGGTDTGGFQFNAGAKPVGALSIPTRYLHTTTESAHLEDIAALIELLTAFLETEDGSHEYTF